MSNLSFPALLLILVVVFLFRKPIKSITDTTTDVVESECNEIRAECLINNNETFKDLKEELGDDFMSTEEIKRYLRKKGMKKVSRQ